MLKNSSQSEFNYVRVVPKIQFYESEATLYFLGVMKSPL